MWSDFHTRVAHSPDMSSIWDRGHREPAALTEPERQRFVWLVAERVFLVEGLFKQYQRGFPSDDSWEQHERTLIGLFDNPIVQSWWSSEIADFAASDPSARRY